MEHQFRRGIYRPNAQRLSISLAPLVAQRSLLFRIKTDRSMKTGYDEMSPMEESPALYTLSATPAASTKVLSAALSVMSALSSGSVYSQDSWKPDSAFVPVVMVDTRRQAVVFSPSLQWSDLSEDDSDRESTESVVKTPPGSASASYVVPVSIVVPKDEALASSDSSHSIDAASLVRPAKSAVEVRFPVKMEVAPVAATKLQKTKNLKTTEDTPAPKRMSKHSKAFSKVISHLSLQPSSTKKDVKTGPHYRKTMNAVHLAPEFLKLPELQVSPIRMSFIAKSPTALPPPAPASRLLNPPFPTVAVAASRIMTPGVVTIQTERDAQATERIHLIRSTMPPPLPPSSYRSTTPPPSTPAPVSFKKSHRRYKSSPAVAHFDFKGRNAEPVPPLPPMPLGPLAATVAPLLPSRPRARARSVMTCAPIRVVSPPFALPEARQS